ncbi:MAG: D-alanine--D-alanine ligase [Desulfovibrionaceae bacterium]|jgi:D-alanine-D-alanine ligase|nr:D-alanine--D-alanine ligase [Desulfovibrionaceae bacterium]
MIVGLTYDLRQDYLDRGFGLDETAEFDRPDTITAIEAALEGLGYETRRIGNAYDLIKALASGARWDLVFNIAEGLYGYGRESLVPALLDAHRIPYVFSDPLTLAVTLHKAVAKRVVRDAGVPTPRFVVFEDLDTVSDAALAAAGLTYPVFAKPVAEGTGKGVGPSSRVADGDGLRTTCAALLATYRQPVLVEEYLPGREFTVGIVGTGSAARVLATMEIVPGAGAECVDYTFVNKDECDSRVEYRLGLDEAGRGAARVALAAYRALNVADAGRVDVRLAADGTPSFMEINPLAGLHPEHSDLPILCTLADISFTDLMDAIMRSAMERVRNARAVRAEAPAGVVTTCGPAACGSDEVEKAPCA